MFQLLTLCRECLEEWWSEAVDGLVAVDHHAVGVLKARGERTPFEIWLVARNKTSRKIPPRWGSCFLDSERGLLMSLQELGMVSQGQTPRPAVCCSYVTLGAATFSP